VRGGEGRGRGEEGGGKGRGGEVRGNEPPRPKSWIRPWDSFCSACGKRKKTGSHFSEGVVPPMMVRIPSLVNILWNLWSVNSRRLNLTCLCGWQEPLRGLHHFTLGLYTQLASAWAATCPPKGKGKVRYQHKLNSLYPCQSHSERVRDALCDRRHWLVGHVRELLVNGA